MHGQRRLVARHGTGRKETRMTRIIGLVILVVGVVLLIMGITEADSLASDISKFFTGNPTDRAVWMIIGGAAAIVLGLVVSLTGPRGKLPA
jgi:uncharacterized membrane protein YidH (DUF202 family)